MYATFPLRRLKPTGLGLAGLAYLRHCSSKSSLFCGTLEKRDPFMATFTLICIRRATGWPDVMSRQESGCLHNKEAQLAIML